MIVILISMQVRYHIVHRDQETVLIIHNLNNRDLIKL
jgi:hypothetical protein